MTGTDPTAPPVPAGPSPQSGTRTPVLRVVAGPDLGEFVVLAPHVDVTVGRSPDAHLVLGHPAMAPQHLRVCWLPGDKVVVTSLQGGDLSAGGQEDVRLRLGPAEPFEVPGAQLQVDLLRPADLERLHRRRRAWSFLSAGEATDPVTGLPLRPWIHDSLPTIMQECRRLGTPLSGAWVVLQGLGESGPAVRRQVARMALLGSRDRDRWVQLSEEELLGVFPGTAPGEARGDLDRLKQEVARAPWRLTAPDLQPRLSTGLAPMEPGASLNDWLAAMGAARSLETEAG